jgi:hypothetical protein
LEGHVAHIVEMTNIRREIVRKWKDNIKIGHEEPEYEIVCWTDSVQVR